MELEPTRKFTRKTWIKKGKSYVNDSANPAAEANPATKPASSEPDFADPDPANPAADTGPDTNSNPDPDPANAAADTGPDTSSNPDPYTANSADTANATADTSAGSQPRIADRVQGVCTAFLRRYRWRPVSDGKLLLPNQWLHDLL